MVIAKSKKYKPQMNNTIKAMEFNWTDGPEPPNNQDAGVAKAIFIPHSDSLPFEERRVTLEQPVKIGRNVYRATSSPTNTIFECRVLSRHHATLSYCRGRFYLVDNGSSNGTFINNNRLPCSISKENRVPQEVFSGDVVQFGIPVIENSAHSEKMVNTFPPVVALLKLYHPDGSEANLNSNPHMTAPLHLNELYQLNSFVQEAVQREAALESRLRNLRECVERTRAEAQASWELFVGEQCLLMRVHTLESMLSLGKVPDANSIAQLLNDKSNYQKVAQDSLRVAHEQRLALEETLDRRSREAAALLQHNCALRLAAIDAFAELQKLATRCERKLCAARLAIAAAEEREKTVRNYLPVAYSVQNGEEKMLVVSSDSNKLQESKRGSLEDAVRALPDYIKFLLPQHLLNKVGIKVLTPDGKTAKEFKRILQNNQHFKTGSKEKGQVEEKETLCSGDEASDDDDVCSDDDLCTDDEKQSRLNHDTANDIEPKLDGEKELNADDNANSTYTVSSTKEDSSIVQSSKAGVKYANVLRVMAGLNEEIKVLRERLNTVTAEKEQLCALRDELLATQEEARAEPSPEPEDAATYISHIADLQAQLSRSTVAEESHVAEIQRLAASAAELQAELELRPARADFDHLTALVAQLHAQLHQLQADKHTLDKCVATSFEDHKEPDPIDTGKISAEIDEMFRLDFEDEDDETDSATTEINKDVVADASNEFVRLGDEARLQVTLANGSLHALEEELVRAKESWAEVCAERARLADQLASLQNKPALRLTARHALALGLPVLAAMLFYLLLPYIS